MSACPSRKALSLVDAVLEAVGRAAFVVDAVRGVVRSNHHGSALLARDGDAVGETLRSVARGARHLEWVATEVVADGQFLHLIVARRRERVVAVPLARAGCEWQLTHRQREVLELLAAGNSNKEIASAFGLSTRTIEAHISTLLEKANVMSRTELLAELHAMAWA